MTKGSETLYFKKGRSIALSAVLILMLYTGTSFFMLPDTVTVYSGISDRIDMNREMLIAQLKAFETDKTAPAQPEPLKDAAIESNMPEEVIPCGITVGVKIDTDGIMVLGTGYVNTGDGASHKPAEGILEAGDLIMTVNQEKVNSKEDLSRAVDKSEENVHLTIKRNGDIKDVNITPVTASEDNIKKIGVWVRDST
ncbi:MAG: PDZ domain-containing protein, partial [Clostridiales bacterium]|nr:PDZ domain-containing protein [Clostridiales bacterium]